MRADQAARIAGLTSAHLADGCIRAGVPVRCAPAGTRGVLPGTRLAGRVLPARHAGSVDVFLEAFEHAHVGDVLVVDNGGRADEACIGDLVVAEAKLAGLAGLLVWGLHRDTADIVDIGLPVYSLGAIPTGPLDVRAREADALTSACVGTHVVTSADLVVADDDGAVFLPTDRLDDVLALGEGIRDTERAQASRIGAGDGLRSQVQLRAYLDKRAQDPTLTFRDHLRAVGGAIEE